MPLGFTKSKMFMTLLFNANLHDI